MRPCRIFHPPAPFKGGILFIAKAGPLSLSSVGILILGPHKMEPMTELAGKRNKKNNGDSKKR
jgi:hypothetical protein